MEITAAVLAFLAVAYVATMHDRTVVAQALLLETTKKRLSVELEIIRTRQAEIDKQMDDQAERIERRERELDLQIARIPRSIEQAIAEFIQPYREMHDEMKGGVTPAKLDLEELGVDELEQAYKKWEAGIDG